MLSGLTELTSLGLVDNELNGDLSAVAQMTRLVELLISDNYFEGELYYLENLTSLEEMRMERNLLSGTIDALADLTRVEIMLLQYNDFDGGIDAVENMPLLTTLSLAHNRFSGTISAVSELTNLQSLSLQNNTFHGDISYVSKLTRLQQTLNLADNMFTGGIAALSDLTSLRNVYLSNNMFRDSLDSVARLTNLQQMWFDMNSFYGNLTGLRDLTSLTVLRLEGNLELNGTLAPISNLLSLRMFWIQDNNITGTLEPLQNMCNMDYLRVDYNNLTGPVHYLACMTNMDIMWLHDNDFNGTMDALENMTKATELYTSFNHFTGNCSFVQKMTELFFFAPAHNQLSGPICPYFTKVTKMSKFGMQINQFTGNIDCLKDMTSMTRLVVHTNQLEGDLKCVENMARINEVDVHNNKFTGTLQTLQDKTQLNSVLVSNNLFGGSIAWIPPSVSRFEADRNNFSSGLDTDFFSNRPILFFVNLSSNALPKDLFESFEMDSESDRPMVLDLTRMSLSCPYPLMGVNVAFYIDSCPLVVTELIVAGSLLLAAAIFSFVYYKFFYDYSRSGIRKVFWMAGWTWRCVWLTMALLFLADIRARLDLPTTNCNFVNSADVFLAFMPWSFDPPLAPSNNFREYVDSINLREREMAITDPGAFPASTAADSVKYFSKVCHYMEGCDYVSDDFSCDAVEPGTEFGDRWKIFRGATDFFFYFLILKELFRVFALLYVMFYTNKYKKIPKELISFVELSPFVPMLGFVGSAFCSDVCAKQDNSFLSNLLSSGIAEGFLTYLPFVALTGKYTLDVAPNSAWDHSTFGAFFGLWMSVGICLRSRSGESTTSQENRKSLLSDYA